MPVKVLKCTCSHNYQDKRYGKNMRVHNQTDKDHGNVWRCTVCKQERSQ